MAVIAIEIDAGTGAGAASAHQSMDAAIRLSHQPETIAADVIHVRVDGRNGGRHGDHGFERVAALGQDRATGLGGGVMRGGDDAAAMSGGVKIHGPGTQ